MNQRKTILAWFLAGAILLLSGCQQLALSHSDAESTAPSLTDIQAAQTTQAAMVPNDDSATATAEPAAALTEAAPVTEPGNPAAVATEAVKTESETHPESSAAAESTSAAPPASSSTQAQAPPQTTEPKPTEPAQAEPAPTQPSQPTEPATSEPKPTEPPHVHSWGAWQQAIAPTCAEPGEERRTCPNCGAVESRPVAATGNHSWEETAPTCTQDGLKTCSVCYARETLSALGHDWVHYDETGHWETLITCYCGAQFYSVDDWEEHATLSIDLEYLNVHAGYEAHPVWAVDSPAQDICSRCGAVK